MKTPRRPSHLDRIEAISALSPDSRRTAGLALYAELSLTPNVTALTWRALGIELHISSGGTTYDTSEDCHQRSDRAGIAQSLRALRDVQDFVREDGSVRLSRGALS